METIGTERPKMSSDQTSSIESIDPTLGRALLCAKAAIDKKAERLKLLDLTELSGFTDYFVICSGTSDRQVQAIADSVTLSMEEVGLELRSTEGHGEGRWILLDFGDVVVHVFLDALREYYDLESLWAEAPRLKIPSEFYGSGAAQLN